MCSRANIRAVLGKNDQPAAAGAAVPVVLSAEFIAEAREPGGFPVEGPPEIAIAGRSNVGKSTLLNRLAGRRGLARTSKTPGRTQGIIFFDLVFSRGQGPATPLRLVDLPGYGYARVSHGMRGAWQKLIEGYVRRRQTLRLFVVLVDARRGIEDEERELHEWLVSENVPLQVVYTKTDKLSAQERGVLKMRGRQPLDGPPVLLVSGETGEGVPALWAAMLRAVTPREP